MDSARLDSLARSVTAAGSRRRILAAALSGALGLVLRAASIEDAPAKKKCPPCKRSKRGKCKPKPNGTACAVGTCQGGNCVAADQCASCTGDQVCSGGACIVPACGAGGPCRVFLSSTFYNGNLGGLVGADAKCQGLAAAVGLSGTYKAWLSDTTGSPSTRFVPSTGPYRLINGTTIAANWADLMDGALLAPISVTETRGGVGTTDSTWTNTLINGNRESAGEHCSNWSTNASPVDGRQDGHALESDSEWTDGGGPPCSAFLHLYCFQQS
jgi:hypothetical protein